MWWLARAEHHLPADEAWLSEREAAYAGGARFTKRRTEYLVARWTAKQALCRVLPTPPATLRGLEVRHAPSGAPLVYLDGEPADLRISLTDRAGWAVCVLGRQAGRMGCDLELVEPRSAAFVADYLTPAERRYVAAATSEDARQLAANLIWSAKESGLKVLTTGLRRDTRSVEVTVGGITAGGAAAGGITAAGADAGWGRLSVRTEEGAVFPGWWRRFGSFVLTLAAEEDLAPPAALDDPPLLAAAAPIHSWLRRPVSAPQPGNRAAPAK
jgi:4'-phosphopantetheinyl transferase